MKTKETKRHNVTKCKGQATLFAERQLQGSWLHNWKNANRPTALHSRCCLWGFPESSVSCFMKWDTELICQLCYRLRSNFFVSCRESSHLLQTCLSVFIEPISKTISFYTALYSLYQYMLKLYHYCTVIIVLKLTFTGPTFSNMDIFSFPNWTAVPEIPAVVSGITPLMLVFNVISLIMLLIQFIGKNLHKRLPQCQKTEKKKKRTNLSHLQEMGHLDMWLHFGLVLCVWGFLHPREFTCHTVMLNLSQF